MDGTTQDQVQLAVVENRLSNIEKLVIRLESKIDVWQANLPTRTELERELGHRDKRIAKLEADNEWLWRLVVGSIFLGSVGLLFFVIQLFIKGGISQ